jgi:hypothetical protein
VGSRGGIAKGDDQVLQVVADLGRYLA